jgi:glycosyltransferase involved in cell wall biosynthesis
VTRIAMLCDYRLRPDRVGGIDRFYWALQDRMLAEGWNVTWLFPDDSAYPHYKGRRFDIALLPKGELLAEAAPFLRRKNQQTDLLVSIFTPYSTRHTFEWRRVGVRRYLALDHMSRPMSPRGAAARAQLKVKGLVLHPFMNGIVAISNYVRDAILHELGWHWSSKVNVIPNGVDTKVFYPSVEPAAASTAAPHVVVVAHLIPEKGVQVLLQALKHGGDRLSGVRVSVAGDGYYRDELQQLTANLDLQDRVHFVGNTACQDSLLRSADIAVVPSLWREAFSLSVIEAMASGVPVVASDIGGIGELLSATGPVQAGCLVPPGDVGALAKALDTLVNNPQLRRQWGAAGVRLARAHYSLERMTGDYFSHMRALVA